MIRYQERLAMNTLRAVTVQFAVLLGVALTTSASAQTLVWEDNFNGPAVDGTKWTYDVGNGCQIGLCGWGNGEMQYYTSRTENARIENGRFGDRSTPRSLRRHAVHFSTAQDRRPHALHVRHAGGTHQNAGGGQRFVARVLDARHHRRVAGPRRNRPHGGRHGRRDRQWHREPPHRRGGALGLQRVAGRLRHQLHQSGESA
ncbi:exported hypothetical protein [Xanthomonas citri pv. fuscans]|nr:exported hypothetical protein [Xanthomonas citri pv. fuscans]SOO03796.1 exported hypothetical protein [Xanthomonas citri pv. fuscans]SOO05027.1 exported hypothetical protein [Xanthomonas citri pv. fuscans]SOO12669.1 exported hypothetical protein [Xanthomonas citri pv. fuscans]SOO46205.1 exported hypothetical protein [Xanthomonas citri pv. fuscans]